MHRIRIYTILEEQHVHRHLRGILKTDTIQKRETEIILVRPTFERK